jgi:uncharacterized protein YbjT (DUF2867 family)
MLRHDMEGIMKIVVIGGTGVIGSRIVEALRGLGHDVLAASLRSGVNTMTRQGLAQALTGGTVEVGAPEPLRFDALLRKGLDARHDPRQVVADPHARYFGAELNERSLVPAGDARLGKTHFDDWLRQPAP